MNPSICNVNITCGFGNSDLYVYIIMKFTEKNNAIVYLLFFFVNK